MSTQAAEMGAITRSVTVDCSVEHAFETFTDRIHEWWPLAKHSVEWHQDRTPAETVIFQGGAGGQVFERTTKGEEVKWADVVAYDPPHRFVLAWNPGRELDRPATEVEVTFAAAGDKTRVELQHRGWEKLGDRGAESRQGYGDGWHTVLAEYEEFASVSWD